MSWPLISRRRAEEERARLEERLARLEEQAEEAVRAEEQRRRLLADISHELATPLTSIRAAAETLLDAGVPTSEEERRQILDGLLGEARRMELLIKDLFDLTRLESGGTDLRREAIDWASLCRHTVERFAPRFAGGGLELRFETTEDEAWVRADGRRLEQVLENLLANTLRYVTAPGQVKVTLRALDEPARYLVEVADDGPGIPETDLARIFDRFYKSDRDRSSPGSGLGLAIVKELMVRHGGDARARNREDAGGTGAVLSVELPAVFIDK